MHMYWVFPHVLINLNVTWIKWLTGIKIYFTLPQPVLYIWSCIIFSSIEPPITGSTSQTGHMMGGTSSSTAYPPHGGQQQQLPVMRSKTSSGGELHPPPSLYQSMDQRELFHSSNSSHSPSRDLTQSQQPQPNQGMPPPQQQQHPSSYPTNNLGQSGQQAPSNYYPHERYPPPQQSQQSQNPIPNQNQVPNQQSYSHYMLYHPQNHPPMGYPQASSGYHQQHLGGMYPSNGTYPYPGPRVPTDLPPDADHQTSITQKR